MNPTKHRLHPTFLGKSESPNRPEASLKKLRSRGIHLKTVSPRFDRKPSISAGTRIVSGDIGEGKREAGNETQSSEDNVNESLEYGSDSWLSPNTSFEMPVPTSADLEKLDMHEKLRLLALKEMAVVEIKDSISNLQQKLNDSERDLSTLRTVIQRSLYRQLGGETKRETDRQNLKALKSTSEVNKVSFVRPGSPERYHSPSMHSASHHKDESVISNPRDANSKPRGIQCRFREIQTQTTENSQNKHSKLWTNLSKPITLIQNIDQMLSQEFEKSLCGDVPKDSGETNHSKSISISGDGDHFRQFMDTKIGGKTPDDMFQAVSNSLWGFVNDVKSNMASTILIDPPMHDYNKSIERGAVSGKNVSPVILSDSSDTESLGDLLEFSDDEEDTVDLAMYSALRKNDK